AHRHACRDHEEVDRGEPRRSRHRVDGPQLDLPDHHDADRDDAVEAHPPWQALCHASTLTRWPPYFICLPADIKAGISPARWRRKYAPFQTKCGFRALTVPRVHQ